MMIVHIQTIPMALPFRLTTLADLINQINRASRHSAAFFQAMSWIGGFILAKHEILGIVFAVFREIEGEGCKRAG
jgi:hypothetical protein